METEKAQLRAAEANASLAKSELDRVAKVLADNGVSKSEYDRAAAGYKESAAQVEAIQASVITSYSIYYTKLYDPRIYFEKTL